MRSQFKNQFMTLILSAFGLVAGLAWNDAIQTLIASLYPIGKNSLPAKFFYAVVVTIAAVIISIVLTKFLGEQEKK